MSPRARILLYGECDDVLRMRELLFTGCPEEQHRRELAGYCDIDNEPGLVRAVGNRACFVLDRADEAGLCGFSEVMLRSQAEGC